MAFIDKAKIYIKSGNGGHGALSFRREKFVEYGGPNGGNGGKGGDVIFRGNKGINTLQRYRFNQHHNAQNGMGGAGQLKTGASGKDLILDVPCGTEIYTEDMSIKIHEILKDDETYHFLRGGQGGKGNAHFKSSTNRAPRKFQQGEKGQESTVRLKLKILADVGLVGMPNAGKSSILNFITNAKSKVADYAFTTLHPHIGMVQKEDLEFVLADIPGLIEHASDGKGLGHDFLSHVERCKILIHVVDITEEKPFENYKERVEFYCQYKQITDATIQKATFLSAMGPDTYAMVKNLCTQAKPSEKTLKELTDMIEDHLSPKKNVIMERFRFNSRNRKEGESVKEYRRTRSSQEVGA